MKLWLGYTLCILGSLACLGYFIDFKNVTGVPKAVLLTLAFDFLFVMISQPDRLFHEKLKIMLVSFAVSIGLIILACCGAVLVILSMGKTGA